MAARQALLDAGMLHGDCLTVTGKTVAENLADIDPPDPDGTILKASNDAIAPTGGITILSGSLAPEGAVVKNAGVAVEVFEGTARVFDREQAAMDALEDGTIQAGDAVTYTLHMDRKSGKLVARVVKCVAQRVHVRAKPHAFPLLLRGRRRGEPCERS